MKKTRWMILLSLGLAACNSSEKVSAPEPMGSETSLSDTSLSEMGPVVTIVSTETPAEAAAASEAIANDIVEVAGATETAN